MALILVVCTITICLGFPPWVREVFFIAKLKVIVGGERVTISEILNLFNAIQCGFMIKGKRCVDKKEQNGGVKECERY